MRKSILLINCLSVLLFLSCNNNNRISSAQMAVSDSLKPDTSAAKVIISAQPLAVDSIPVIGTQPPAQKNGDHNSFQTDTLKKNTLYPSHRSPDQDKIDSIKTAKSKLKK